MGVTFSSPDLAGGIQTSGLGASSATPLTFSFGFAATDTKSFGVSASISQTEDPVVTPYATFSAAAGPTTISCVPITFPTTTFTIGTTTTASPGTTYNGPLVCNIPNTDISPGTATIAFEYGVDDTTTDTLYDTFVFIIATATSTTTSTATVTAPTITSTPSTTISVLGTTTSTAIVTLTGASSTTIVPCVSPTATTNTPIFAPWNNSTSSTTTSSYGGPTITITNTHTICPCDSTTKSPSTTTSDWAIWHRDDANGAKILVKKAAPVSEFTLSTTTTTTTTTTPINYSDYGPPSLTFAAAYTTTTVTVTNDLLIASTTSTITFTSSITTVAANTTITKDLRTLATVNGCTLGLNTTTPLTSITPTWPSLISTTPLIQSLRHR